MQRIAITRRPGAALARCLLTHIEREPIEVGLAVRQHALYEEALAELGFIVVSLPPSEEFPDGCFVEDTAVVLGTSALVTRPGDASRRGETRDIASLLEERVELTFVEPPGTIDGGDVLVTGKRIFAGLTTRTNEDGVRQLAAFAETSGFSVTPVAVNGSLHLKTAVTEVASGVLVINRDWVDASVFDGYELIDVDPREPFGANVLRCGEGLLYPSNFPRTRDRIAPRAGEIRSLDFSEFLKAEAGLTCCCILVESEGA